MNQKQLDIGKRIEAEHMQTYNKLKKIAGKKMPSKQSFFKSIAREHLKEDAKYYTKLKKANL